MAARTAQIVSRGTAFGRAATWTMNSIMAAGAAGVEIGVAGKLRSDRSRQGEVQDGRGPQERGERRKGGAACDHRRPPEAWPVWDTGQHSAEGRHAPTDRVQRDQMEGGDAGSQAGPAPAEQVAPPEAKQEALPEAKQEAKPEAEAAKPAVTDRGPRSADRSRPARLQSRRRKRARLQSRRRKRARLQSRRRRWW